MDLLEDIIFAFGHKNPQVKNEAIQWLIRCLKTPKQPSKELTRELKHLAEALVKVIGFVLSFI